MAHNIDTSQCSTESVDSTDELNTNLNYHPYLSTKATQLQHSLTPGMDQTKIYFTCA